jgi:TonB family protein
MRCGGLSVLFLLLIIVLAGSAQDTSSPQTGDSTKAAPAIQYAPRHYLKIEKHIVPPKPLDTPQPANGAPTCKVKHEGTVLLWIGINELGTVDIVKVERSLDLALDGKAIEAVKKWRFAPATKDGQPVPVQTNVEVHFTVC